MTTSSDEGETSGTASGADFIDAEPSEVDGHVLLTRAQAARRIGVSVATIRRMEGAELRPVIVNGKHCFAIDEVDRHQKMTDGDLAAHAFQMFNADKTQVDVVIALKESPERIRRLFRDWVEMSECVVAARPGLGHALLRRWFNGRVTRRFITTCIELLFADPRLRARAEAELAPEEP